MCRADHATRMSERASDGSLTGNSSCGCRPSEKKIYVAVRILDGDGPRTQTQRRFLAPTRGSAASSPTDDRPGHPCRLATDSPMESSPVNDVMRIEREISGRRRRRTEPVRSRHRRPFRPSLGEAESLERRELLAYLRIVPPSQLDISSNVGGESVSRTVDLNQYGETGEEWGENQAWYYHSYVDSNGGYIDERDGSLALGDMDLLSYVSRNPAEQTSIGTGEGGVTYQLVPSWWDDPNGTFSFRVEANAVPLGVEHVDLETGKTLDRTFYYPQVSLDGESLFGQNGGGDPSNPDVAVRDLTLRFGATFRIDAGYSWDGSLLAGDNVRSDQNEAIHLQYKVPDPKPDLRVNSFGTDATGVHYSYAVATVDTHWWAPSGLFWSPTPTYDPDTAIAIAGTEFLADHTPGLYPFFGEEHVDYSVLGTPPEGATNLLLVLDEPTSQESDGAGRRDGRANNVSSIPFRASSTTRLDASTGSVPYGATVTLTARVSTSTGTATGQVDFSEGQTEYGTRSLSNGVASLSLDTLGVGTHTITAHYLGDGSIPSSDGYVTVTVTKADTDLDVSATVEPAGTPVYGQTIRFTASVGVAAPGGGIPDRVRGAHGRRRTRWAPSCCRAGPGGSTCPASAPDLTPSRPSTSPRPTTMARSSPSQWWWRRLIPRRPSRSRPRRAHPITASRSRSPPRLRRRRLVPASRAAGCRSSTGSPGRRSP